MADLGSFIHQAARNLGMDEKTARGATGSLLGFLRRRLDDADFASLRKELQGADDVWPAEGARAMAGGKLAVASGIVGALTEGGLEISKVAGFVGHFLGFAKTELGDELMERIMTKAPELRGVSG